MLETPFLTMSRQGEDLLAPNWSNWGLSLLQLVIRMYDSVNSMYINLLQLCQVHYVILFLVIIVQTLKKNRNSMWPTGPRIEHPESRSCPYHMINGSAQALSTAEFFILLLAFCPMYYKDHDIYKPSNLYIMCIQSRPITYFYSF